MHQYARKMHVCVTPRQENCCFGHTLHVMFASHVGRRRSMLAMPLVLRQASKPIQYPCNGSAQLSQQDGLSEQRWDATSSREVQCPHCTDLVEEIVRRALLSFAGSQARSHAWERTLGSVQDSAPGLGRNLLSACLSLQKMQNGWDFAPCRDAEAMMILTVLSKHVMPVLVKHAGVQNARMPAIVRIPVTPTAAAAKSQVYMCLVLDPDPVCPCPFLSLCFAAETFNSV